MVIRGAVVLGIALLSLNAAAAPVLSSAAKTYEDVRKTLGFVPQFIMAYPTVSIAGAWAELKNVHFNPDTALSPKQKNLIGLAVASQIPCGPCVTFYTEGARQEGANAAELKEAVALAALSRHWSTVFKGFGESDSKLRAELARMHVGIHKHESEMSTELGLRPGTANSAETAYGEMRRAFGFVPSFMEKFPPEGVAGAWETFKTLWVHRATAIEPATRKLISLAVAAQTPCEPCVYWETDGLKRDGVIEKERSEAVAVAALARHWSAVWSGSPEEIQRFEEETRKILRFLKRGGAKTAAASAREAARRE